MRTAHLSRTDLVVLAALLLLSIVVVALGAGLIRTRAATASALGSGWQCHGLLNVEICGRIAATGSTDQRSASGTSRISTVALP